MAKLKREERESGELISFLSTMGKPRRGKYATRLRRNRVRRWKSVQKSNAKKRGV